MPITHVNGFSMYYRDFGGSRSGVVFIHGGFPSLATVWDPPGDEVEPWQREIAGRHRLLTYSRRGYHPSSCPSSGYAIDEQAADVIGLLDTVGLGQVHLVGSSAGGPIAYCTAARHPDRVRSVALVGTGLNLRRTLRDRPDVVRILTEQIELFASAGPAAASQARPPGCEVSFDPLFMASEFAERGERAQYEQRRAEEERWLATVADDTRVQFHAAEIRAVAAYLAWDGTEEAESVRCRALVVHGRRDRAITLDEGVELASLIPTAQVEVFPESHSLLWRHKPALATTLRFFAEVDRTPTG